jgi:ectoine hydroxylase-related dioxygenase (phytanoyl-CoA dioxygenase family)
MASPYEFSFTGTDSDVEETIKRVKKFGFAIVRNYVSGPLLESLDHDHGSAFSDQKNSGLDLVKGKHADNHGEVVRLNRLGMKDQYKSIYSVFSAPSMDAVSKRYVRPHDYQLNREVFLTHEVPHEKSIFPWHFDRIHYLKFYVYITDTTKENGAFEYEVASHRETFFRFNYYSLIGESVEGLPYIIPDDEIVHPYVLEGKAGDLIVFDAGGIHKGGIVSPGKIRRVARGHTNVLPFKGYDPQKPFTKSWWLKSPFNLARYFQKDVCRVMSEEMKPGGLRGNYKDH